MRASKRGGESVAALAAFLALSSGCNVESTTRGTGGVKLDGGSSDGSTDGSTGGDSARGLVVVNSDYQSTMVSLLSPTGEVKSPSFIGSGSAAPGLSAALGEDIAIPSSRVPGNEVVLLDSHVPSVITWMNLETAKARAQLSVTKSTNPHDYVPYTKTKAFVPRYDPAPSPGRAPFDAGSDLLVIDPSVPEITGAIDLTSVMDGEDPAFFPHPHRALVLGGKIRLSCSAFNGNFTQVVDARLVSVDPETEAITQVLVLRGLHGDCGLSPSPDGKQLAVACSGKYDQDPALGFADSGVVLLDVKDELVETRRFTAKDWGTEQVYGAEWSSASTLLVTIAGRRLKDAKGTLVSKDAVRSLDLDSGDLGPPLVESKNAAFVLGVALCETGLSTCFVPDAEPAGGVLHQLSVDAAGQAEVERSIVIDTGLGVPPRVLGRF